MVGIHIVYQFFKKNKDFLATSESSKSNRDQKPPKKPAILYCGPSNKSVDIVAGELCIVFFFILFFFIDSRPSLIIHTNIAREPETYSVQTYVNMWTIVECVLYLLNKKTEHEKRQFTFMNGILTLFRMQCRIKSNL